jgi:hypothetical protein
LFDTILFNNLEKRFAADRAFKENGSPEIMYGLFRLFGGSRGLNL